MQSRSAGGRSSGKLSRKASIVDSGVLAEHWTRLSLDERLRCLRFEDQVLVQRSFSILQTLQHNELLCYYCGIRRYDKGGSMVLRVGLDEFDFEPCSGNLSQQTRGLGDDHKSPMVALCAKREFVEKDNFLAILEARLGKSLMDSRKPPPHRRDWASIFEPAPNSWHEYERQCLRLVSFAVIEACSENPSQRPHAESIPAEALLLASAVHALEDIEEQVDGRTNNTQHKNSKKKARRRQKTRNEKSSPTVLLQNHTEEKEGVEQEQEEDEDQEKAVLGGPEANEEMEEEDDVEAEEEDDGDVADEEDEEEEDEDEEEEEGEEEEEEEEEEAEEEEEEEEEQETEQDSVASECNENDSELVSEDADTVKDKERAEDVKQGGDDNSKGAKGEIDEQEMSRLLDKSLNEDSPNHGTSLDMFRDVRQESEDWTDSPLVTWTTVSRRRGRGARHLDRTEVPCPLRPLDKQNPATAPRELCQAPEPQFEGTSTTEATDQSTGDYSAGSSIESPRSAPGLPRDEEHEAQPSRSCAACCPHLEADCTVHFEDSEDDHINVEFCVLVKHTFLHAERVVPQAHRRARSAGGRLSSSFAE